MLILSCPAQLQRLEGALRRSLPLTLPVHGAVMNINRGNPGDFEVVVDAWPDFRAVLARYRGEVAAVESGERGWGRPPPPTRAAAPQVPADDCYMNMHAAFYHDLGAYRALLESPGAVRWDTAFHIFGGAGAGGHRREELGGAGGEALG
ncbi:GLYL3 protein, partial [Nothocercus julius]|nr:GLYL3 protein [Nothocercus julius]